jgi:hypothetical protein
MNMKRRTPQFSALPALLGLLALGSAEAVAAGQKPTINCEGSVDVTPEELQNGNGSCTAPACQSMNNWIKDKARDYTTAVQQACQHSQSLLSKMGENNQQGSQKNAKSNYSDASSSMGNVIDKGKTIKRETVVKAKQYLKQLDPSGRSQMVRAARDKFTGENAFNERKLEQNPLERDDNSNISQNKAMASNAAEFMHKLEIDIKKREAAKDGFDKAAAQSQDNADNSGAAKDKDGKGMDPSSLMGPLAALAGMANQKKGEDPAASGLSDPAAAAAAPAEAKLANSVVKGTNLGSGSSKTGAAAAKVAEMDKGAQDAGPTSGSQLGSGLSTSAYKDAFTGFGANGTTPGTFSPTSSGASSGGAGGGGAGAGSERGTASATHSPSEEEALQSFGGGGLNFAGGSGGSSTHSGDEGVKDFLQDAETALSDGTFADAPEGELAAAETGVEGEDGTELFRRVRSALERSQRKGAVLSGLSGPKDPRYR